MSPLLPENKAVSRGYLNLLRNNGTILVIYNNPLTRPAISGGETVASGGGVFGCPFLPRLWGNSFVRSCWEWDVEGGGLCYQVFSAGLGNFHLQTVFYVDDLNGWFSVWCLHFFMTHEKWVVHQRSSEDWLFFYSIGKSLGSIVHNRTYPNSQPRNRIAVFFRCNSLKGSKRAQPSAVLPCKRFLLRIYGRVFLEVEREVLEANKFMKSGESFFWCMSYLFWNLGTFDKSNEFPTQINPFDRILGGDSKTSLFPVAVACLAIT